MSLAVPSAQGAVASVRNPALGPAGWIALYGVVWGAAAVSLTAHSPAPLGALGALAFMGVLLPAAAWELTRSARPESIPVERPWRELAITLAYLLFYAVAALGLALGLVQAWLSRGRAFELVTLDVKLVLTLIAPLALLALFGAKIRPLLALRLRGSAVWATFGVLASALVLFDAFATPSLQRLDLLHPTGPALAWAAPACFVWLAVQSGLCEEVLFRAVLQSRLAAALNSEAGAAVLGAFAFALTHAAGASVHPGVLRSAGLPGLIPLAGYAVGVLSPIGLLFGVVWARTRSLGLLILLHATIDFLPNLPEFIRTWT